MTKRKGSADGGMSGLKRLVDTEAKLAEKVARARREAREIIEAARAEEECFQGRLEEEIGAATEELRIEVEEYRRASLAAEEERARSQLERYRCVGRDELDRLARMVVDRVLKESAG